MGAGISVANMRSLSEKNNNLWKDFFFPESVFSVFDVSISSPLLLLYLTHSHRLSEAMECYTHGHVREFFPDSSCVRRPS